VLGGLGLSTCVDTVIIHWKTVRGEDETHLLWKIAEWHLCSIMHTIYMASREALGLPNEEELVDKSYNTRRRGEQQEVAWNLVQLQVLLTAEP
jgi:hypothetical protein